jgi:cytoskeleton protein RodZ
MTMTDEVIVEPATPVASEFASLGERLLAAREAKKLSQQDVSDSLRFSVKQINALERGDYDALPDAMITRGFIRNYARLVELDAEPLLTSYRVYVPDQLPGTLSMESLMHEVMPGKDSQPWLQYILGSILVLLFLLAWFFYMDYMPKPVSAESEKAPLVAAADNAPVEINMPEIALPAEERLTASSDAEATKLAASDANQVTTTPIAPLNTATDVSLEAAAKTKLPVVAAVDAGKLKADAAKPAAVAVQAAAQSEAAVKAEVAMPAPAKVVLANMKKVTMSFSDESWVRATDKSGKIVFEKILPAGSQDGFEGVPPLNLVIGNASATKLIYLGKSVDLAAVTQGNVARLTLE